MQGGSPLASSSPQRCSRSFRQLSLCPPLRLLEGRTGKMGGVHSPVCSQPVRPGSVPGLYGRLVRLDSLTGLIRRALNRPRCGRPAGHTIGDCGFLHGFHLEGTTAESLLPQGGVMGSWSQHGVRGLATQTLHIPNTTQRLPGRQHLPRQSPRHTDRQTCNM